MIFLLETYCKCLNKHSLTFMASYAFLMDCGSMFFIFALFCIQNTINFFPSNISQKKVFWFFSNFLREFCLSQLPSRITQCPVADHRWSKNGESTKHAEHTLFIQIEQQFKKMIISAHKNLIKLKTLRDYKIVINVKNMRY